jgi:hypothetical protein
MLVMLVMLRGNMRGRSLKEGRYGGTFCLVTGTWYLMEEFKGRIITCIGFRFHCQTKGRIPVKLIGEF